MTRARPAARDRRILMTRYLWLAAVPVVFVLGCGSAKPAASEAGADASAAATDMSAPDGAATPPEGGGDAGAATSAAAGAADKPADKPGPAETKKDADAIVLEITVAPKGKAKLDDAAKSGLIAAANERIRASSKLASPESKGITTPRKVLANLLVEEPGLDKKKGLTVRLELTGVSKDGQCPLFSLGSNVAMSDGKPDNAGDVEALRKGALMSLFDQLEATAPTVKPTNNCTVNKK
jgi:hypothetical protein